jgi:hypothetical protein
MERGGARAEVAFQQSVSYVVHASQHHVNGSPLSELD